MSPVDYSIKDAEKVVQGIDGEIKNVEVTRLTAPGENYLSLVFRVDFQVEKDGETTTVSTVAKRLPLGERKTLDFNALAMRNEIKWYSEILPQIKEFGKEFGINADYYPEYLGGRLSLDPSQTNADSESVLFLKNLIPEGYKNEDRLVGFDLISTKTILKNLAAFHSIPLIMRFKKPEQLKAIKDFIDSSHPEPPPHLSKDGPANDAEEEKPFPNNMILQQMLELPACQPYKANIEAVQNQPMGPDMWHKIGPDPWNTILHTDYWVNNIMVKCREGQSPLVKMVDFQFYSYSSFAKDLVFFLLTSVNNDVLKENIDELFRHYYEELTSILDNADIPELKLSYEDYLEEVKRVTRESEFNHAVFFSTVIFAVRGVMPDFLAGEGDMFDHLEFLSKTMNDLQKEKLELTVQLCGARGWI